MMRSFSVALTVFFLGGRFEMLPTTSFWEKPKPEWNGMEPIKACTFSFFTLNIITHHTLKILTQDFVFPPTDSLETLFVLKLAPKFPTVTHVLARIVFSYSNR